MQAELRRSLRSSEKNSVHLLSSNTIVRKVQHPDSASCLKEIKPIGTSVAAAPIHSSYQTSQ